MFRDPLYRQIRRRLRELKDGNNFELCANDLLSKIFPTLAPREGGDDAGLDGLIAKEGTGSIQLICTTGEDVLGNLSGSIKSSLQKGGKSQACILATSQRLTNSKKRTLEERANNLGRTLIQIYDQAAMAQLLYRDARWLKELLGLSGDPPPLSLFPITSRPLFDVPPVGRDDDIRKIIQSTGDFVLVGQPGSGKTHLFFTVAKKARGRFVVDEDVTRVADGVRSIQPRFLIVDDAHSHLDFLKRLKLLRQQIGAEYQIMASCWPGQEDAVIDALQLTKAKCHVLEGLPQKQIKEVIQSQKIFGPEHLLTEIIHQSQGKPGLAVTLCRLCWESGTRDVVLGKALEQDVKMSFARLLGLQAIHLLACFSIGGGAGMTLEAVARLTGKNTFEVKHLAEQLAAAGMLDISVENRISVHPMRLRQALVRDEFLKPPAIDLTPYLSEAPDYAATTCVLIEAKSMGGTLSDAILRHRLQQLSGTYEQAAFGEYAHLGWDEAEWVLDTFPDRIQTIGPVALHASPEKALKMLLDFALVTYEERSSQHWSTQTEDIMPEIKKWILSAKPSDEDAARRRQLLANSVAKWFAVTQNVTVAVRAAELAMSIKHEATSTPPGEPMVVTFHSGVVTQSQLPRIASLWPIVLPIFSKANPSQEREIANIFHEWIHPDSHGRNTPKEYEDESRDHARRMMGELLDVFAGNWTMHHHLYNYADKLGLTAKIRIDPIAGILYPPRDYLDWKNEEKRCQTAADALASQLSDKDPTKVADSLTTIEEQAQAASISHPSWGRHVCSRIADITDNPTVWIKALFDRGAPAYLIEFFLEKITANNPSGAEPWISLALERPTLQMLGVSIVLKHFDQQKAIWQKASPLFINCIGRIEVCVLRNEVRNANLKTLLNHQEPMVAAVVAASLWGIRDDANIPDDLFEDWKRVMIRHVDEHHEHILEKVFPKYPEIAYGWIAWRVDGIRDGTRPFWFGTRYDRALPSAIDALTKPQKKELIDRLPRNSAVTELVHSLVGRDMELFLHLLARKELEGIRLDPFRLDFGSGLHAENVVHDFNDGWQEMAIAAMEAGFSEQDIYYASQAGGYGWSGSMSSMFSARLAPFEKLLQHADARLRRIGQIGFEHFSIQRDEYLAREKQAAIRG
jgi:hypothetical protein